MNASVPGDTVPSLGGVLHADFDIRGREFLASDARKDGVKKGHYETPDEAQRKITKMLLEMWERHDVATYPMEGIDIKTVLNYRNSEQIVYWAKTLAYELTRLAEQTDTTDELRNALRGVNTPGGRCSYPAEQLRPQYLRAQRLSGRKRIETKEMTKITPA